MKLGIKDRLSMGNILQKESDIITMMTIKEISQKVEVTKEERAEIGLIAKDGMLKWDDAKEVIKDISFTDQEMSILKDAVEKLDSTKKITIDLLDLCRKIKDEVKQELATKA